MGMGHLIHAALLARKKRKGQKTKACSVWRLMVINQRFVTKEEGNSPWPLSEHPNTVFSSFVLQRSIWKLFFLKESSEHV
jgi:hypothetical protein